MQEVAKSQFAIKANADYAYSVKAVAAELSALGVDADCMQKGFDEMDEAVAQRASLVLVACSNASCCCSIILRRIRMRQAVSS